MKYKIDKAFINRVFETLINENYCSIYGIANLKELKNLLDHPKIKKLYNKGYTYQFLCWSIYKINPEIFTKRIPY